MPTQKITRTQLPGALKAHAIIIAINEYSKIGAHLRTPIADGRALGEALVNFQGFAPENVHHCFDPTKKELEAFFADRLAEGTIEATDALLFYYAGHGLAGDIDGAGAAGYLMPSDVSFSIAELSKNETLIKMEWLFEQLEAFQCHHTLAIMDCCFAGAFRRISLTRASMGLGLRPMSEERFNRYQEKKAWQVLASAGPAEKAADLISDRGETANNSPFAEALIEALSGKARPDFKPPGKNLGDGVLTTHELFIYLHDEVERRTRDATAFKPQNPDLFPMGTHDGGQFVFCDPRHPRNQPQWDERERENPYKGLKQYDLKDADFYFGRTSDVEALRGIMQINPSAAAEENSTPRPALLAITGPSGSGKSSLVKAGLLPAFLERGYEVFQFRPGNRPWTLEKYQEEQWVEVLTSESHPFRFTPATGAPEESSEIKFTFGQHFFLDATAKQVLYIDQFEELFTTCNPTEQAALNIALKEIFDAALQGDLHLVISMRSDFEWQLELSEFGQQFWGQEKAYYQYFKLYRLMTLGLDDLRAALVNPAVLFAYEFAQDEKGDLVDEILEDLNYLPSALPLLSYTMQEMVNKTTNDEREFKRTTYRNEVGGVSGALSKRMQIIYDSFGAKEPSARAKVGEETPVTPRQDLLRTIFLRMVSLSDGDYVRRRVYRDQQVDELVFAQDNRPVKEILDALRQAGLISTGGEAGIRYEELIHDSLINTWTTGKKWINDFGKENLSLQRELWKAVLDSSQAPAFSPRGYEIPQDADARALVGMDTSFSRLWDTNPKLLQVIKQVADASLFLLEEDQASFLEEVLEDAQPAEKETFFEFWHECHSKQEFPDLNALILSGYSGKLLKVLLERGKHRLNLAEVNFIQQSWTERIHDVMDLKRERDEAQAAYERTTTEMIEASWKTGVYLEANPESQRIQGDWLKFGTVPGVRTMYDQLKIIMSLEKVQSLSPIPVFVKGPHTKDYNLESDEFGYYNPEFLAWAKTRVIPAKNKPVLRKLTQPFYDAYMKEMARSYYLAYLHLQKYPVQLERRVAVYASGGTVSTPTPHIVSSTLPTGVDDYEAPKFVSIQRALGGPTYAHYFFTAVEFWARRNIDTTAVAFAEILKDLLETYDQEWLDRKPDGDWVYGRD